MASRAEAEEPTGATLGFEQQDIEEAIRDYPREATEAMALIQADTELPLSAETIRTLAASSRRPVESFWYEQLEILGLIRRFGLAMRGAGVPVATASPC